MNNRARVLPPCVHTFTAETQQKKSSNRRSAQGTNRKRENN